MGNCSRVGVVLGLHLLIAIFPRVCVGFVGFGFLQCVVSVLKLMKRLYTVYRDNGTRTCFSGTVTLYRTFCVVIRIQQADMTPGHVPSTRVPLISFVPTTPSDDASRHMCSNGILKSTPIQHSLISTGCVVHGSHHTIEPVIHSVASVEPAGARHQSSIAFPRSCCLAVPSLSSTHRHRRADVHGRTDGGTTGRNAHKGLGPRRACPGRRVRYQRAR